MKLSEIIKTTEQEIDKRRAAGERVDTTGGGMAFSTAVGEVTCFMHPVNSLSGSKRPHFRTWFKLDGKKISEEKLVTALRTA